MTKLHLWVCTSVDESMRTKLPVARASLLALVGLAVACAEVRSAPEVDDPTLECSSASCAGICVEGVCKNSCEQAQCDDGNPCTSDVCNQETGDCEFPAEPDDTECLEGAGLCADGTCVDQMRCEGVTCDDGNDCTIDECDPTDGECFAVAVQDDQTCDFEGSAGLCKSGECEDAMLCIGADCGDGDLCTNDECDPFTGTCSNPDLVCEDANLCTTDSCDSGSGCVFSEKNCSDGNVCTDDNCDPATGNCSNPNRSNGTDCDSYANCDPFEFCFPIPGSCVLGSCIVCSSNGSCSDLNPCTSDTCTSGRCSYANLPNGTSCGSKSQCLLGRCIPVIVSPF